MAKKTDRDLLKNKEKELERIKKDNLALLKTALKQAEMNKELSEGMKKLMDINKKLSDKLKKSKK